MTLPSTEDLTAVTSVFKALNEFLALLLKVADFINKTASTYKGVRTPNVLQSTQLLNSSPSREPTSVEDAALAKTLGEWEKIACSVLPELASKIIHKKISSDSFERSRNLSNAISEYMKNNLNIPIDVKNLGISRLAHSNVSLTSDGLIRIRFGQSVYTKSLQEYTLIIPLKDLLNGNTIAPINTLGVSQPPLSVQAESAKIQPKATESRMPPLPVLKITMLGDSGTGKTVFMSSMYASLRNGRHGIALRAVEDKTDLELDAHMKNIYLLNNPKWPPGSDMIQQNYRFELLIEGRPTVEIDWVDYRGGAIVEDPGSQAGKALAERLRESNAIIWMVDMSRIANLAAGAMKQRLITGVSRMAAICRHAVAHSDEPRAWIFVRTKSDTVRSSNDELPDWKRAVDELLEHLGSIVDIAKVDGRRFSRSAAVPISSVGRVNKGTNNADVVVGDDPSFVDWPLLLSIAFLLEAKYEQMYNLHDQSSDALRQQPDSALMSIVRRFVELEPTPEELQAKNIQQFAISQMSAIKQYYSKLLQGCPSTIRILDR